MSHTSRTIVPSMTSVMFLVRALARCSNHQALTLLRDPPFALSSDGALDLKTSKSALENAGAAVEIRYGDGLDEILASSAD
jgi:hypothetical protein